MRIARIRHLFYPEMPQDYFYELSARQAKQGHDVHVLTWHKSIKYPKKMVGQGFSIHRLLGVNFGIIGTVKDYPYLPGLSSELERIKPDIIHGESHLFLTSIQALRKANSSNLPFVVTIHGVLANRSLGINLSQKMYLFIMSQVFKRADRIICLNKSDALELMKYGFSAEKIRLIPNAVDTDLFRPGLEHQDNLVLWVGRFVPEKGLEYLIKAAKIVVHSIHNVRFLLVGYGPEKTKIINLARDYELLGSSVFFQDCLSRTEISKIMDKAEIFVFPSLKEGLPLSVLEAAACGLPVIGFDIPGVNDIVIHGKSGLLVPSGDINEFARMIVYLLKDKDFGYKLGCKARQLVIEKYNWELVLNSLQKVYDEAIDETAIKV